MQLLLAQVAQQFLGMLLALKVVIQFLQRLLLLVAVVVQLLTHLVCQPLQVVPAAAVAAAAVQGPLVMPQGQQVLLTKVMQAVLAT
jgi:hypothetical protein